MTEPFRVETIHLDLPALAGAFSRRLREAGLPVTAERAARFAHALDLVRPVSRRRLYWTARAALVSDPAQVKAFDRVFFEVFGLANRRPSRTPDHVEPARERSYEGPDTEQPGSPGPRASTRATRAPGSSDETYDEVPVPTAASDEEVLREKRFDALDPAELARLYRLMSRLEIATPRRRTRRAKRQRRGEHIDMRRTLRGSLRTAATRSGSPGGGGRSSAAGW